MKTKQTMLWISFILSAFLFVWIVAGGRGISSAFAAVSGYTGPLADLQQDENFNADDYPDDADDYSVNLIQIAESSDGELFIYTYQPCQKTTYLVATHVNMSLSESVDGTALYGLTLLGSDGVLCKYLVNGVTVSDDDVRYYNITSIYRDWLQGVDEDTDYTYEQTVNEVSFEVGQLWSVYEDSGETVYTCDFTKVVVVENKLVGFVRYPDGFSLFVNGACDSHFVAFSCNYDIDKLYEADVYYVSQSYTFKYVLGSGNKETYGDLTENYAYLTADSVSYKGSGLFSKTYTWNRIETVEDFKSGLGNNSVSYTNGSERDLNGMQWVLRFAETSYSLVSTGEYYNDTRTIVSDVVILRLKFDYEGEIYNLGVVDNMQTGSSLPFAESSDSESFWAWLADLLGISVKTWKIIVYCILGLLIFAVVLPVLSLIFPLIGSVLKLVFKGVVAFFTYLFSALWWLLRLPFRGMAALVRKLKDRKNSS